MIHNNGILERHEKSAKKSDYIIDKNKGFAIAGINLMFGPDMINILIKSQNVLLIEGSMGNLRAGTVMS